MRAAHTDTYGAPTDVLRVKEVPKPDVPADKIRIRVIAAGTHAGDWHLIRGTPYFIRLLFGGIFKPTVNIPGCELCGVVEAIGTDVPAEFATGDVVFGDVSEVGFGAFAEFVCVPPSAVVKKPPNVSAHQAAAACTSATAALQALRDVAKVERGQNVLVVGASGGVGSFAVQMAKVLGANVTAVCHGDKAAVINSLGPDAVVDYTKHDVVDIAENEGKFDAIVDTACFRSPSDYARILGPNGIYVCVGGATSRFMQVMIAGPLMSRMKGMRISSLESKPSKADMLVIQEWLQDGKIVSLIDRAFSFDQVADAVRYVEDRKVTGKAIINVSEE